MKYMRKWFSVQGLLVTLAMLLFVTACSTVTPLAILTPPVTPSLTATQTTTLTITPTLTSTSTPTRTSTSTPTSTPTTIPTPLGGGIGTFVFSGWKKDYESLFPDLKGNIHVFMSNVDGTDLKPITHGLEAGNYYIFEGMSPDGDNFLIIATVCAGRLPCYGDLYIIDFEGSNPIKLAEDVLLQSFSGRKTALWLPDGRIAFIAQNGKEDSIFLVNPDGSGLTQLKKSTSLDSHPMHLLSMYESMWLYWEAGYARTSTSIMNLGYRRTNIETLYTEEIWENLNIRTYAVE